MGGVKKSKSSTTKKSKPKQKGGIRADKEDGYDLDFLDEAIAKGMTWDEVVAARPEIGKVQKKLEQGEELTHKDQKILDKVTGGERIRSKKDWIDTWRGRIYQQKEQDELSAALRVGERSRQEHPEKIRQLARDVAQLTPEERKRIDPALLEALEAVWREEQYEKKEMSRRQAKWGKDAMTPQQTRTLEDMVEREWEREERRKEPVPKRLNERDGKPTKD